MVTTTEQSSFAMSKSRKLAKKTQHIKRRRIRKLVVSLRAGHQLLDSCQRVGLHVSTVWRWRKFPRPFSRYWHQRLDLVIERNLERCHVTRIEAVEDALYQRLISGVASPTDYIFWLTNQAPDRWKDRRAVVANTNTNITTLRVDAQALKVLGEDELRHLARLDTSNGHTSAA